MAAQPPLGPRKRSGPEPCAAGWAGPGPGPAPPAAAGRSGGALENGFPPHKRPRSSGAAGPEEGPSDPFGDNDDFTADDLEEIDILASQALSQEAAAAAAPPRHAWAAFGASGAERRAAAGQPRGVAPAAGRRPKGSGRRRAVGPRRLLPSAGGGFAAARAGLGRYPGWELRGAVRPGSGNVAVGWRALGGLVEARSAELTGAGTARSLAGGA